jgi:general secretion pathway protein G
MKTQNRRILARSAFTLMEVLVVVAIVVIMAMAGGVIYTKYLDDAKKDRARMDVTTLTTTAETYYVKHGGYPNTLAELTNQQPDGSKPYLEISALTDPWGRPYQYANPGQRNVHSGKPDIWSDGPNYGNPAGIIGNWPASAGAGGH